MIDKIQNCISNSQLLMYTDKNISISKLKDWNEWFIKNKVNYCLDNIYSIESQQKLQFKKMFASQTVENPHPDKLKELNEYLSNIIETLEKRAADICNSIK